MALDLTTSTANASVAKTIGRILVENYVDMEGTAVSKIERRYRVQSKSKQRNNLNLTEECNQAVGKHRTGCTLSG